MYRWGYRQPRTLRRISGAKHGACNQSSTDNRLRSRCRDRQRKRTDRQNRPNSLSGKEGITRGSTSRGVGCGSDDEARGRGGGRGVAAGCEKGKVKGDLAVGDGKSSVTAESQS